MTHRTAASYRIPGTRYNHSDRTARGCHAWFMLHFVIAPHAAAEAARLRR